MRPSVVELFAGAGLFSYAFACEQFDIIRAIEIDSIAAETYRWNLGNHIEVADVRTAQTDRKCQVLIAGPPCQGFSTLGARDPSDPRNRLSLEVVRWARCSSPMLWLLKTSLPSLILLSGDA
jgi:DNA (cytosine-5)-methyltransferase 1